MYVSDKDELACKDVHMYICILVSSHISLLCLRNKFYVPFDQYMVYLIYIFNSYRSILRVKALFWCIRTNNLHRAAPSLSSALRGVEFQLLNMSNF